MVPPGAGRRLKRDAVDSRGSKYYLQLKSPSNHTKLHGRKLNQDTSLCTEMHLVETRSALNATKQRNEELILFSHPVTLPEPTTLDPDTFKDEMSLGALLTIRSMMGKIHDGNEFVSCQGIRGCELIQELSFALLAETQQDKQENSTLK